tara:strand:+ start:5104 stop:5613 length:510 start_codon:yes stop_codon:yes gene_type:complete
MQNDTLPVKMLTDVAQSGGLLWERIANFKEHISSLPGALTHKAGEPQSEGLKKYAPLKHTFEGGLYTRQLSLPKGQLIISLIHKHQHPTFLLKGRMSYIGHDGEVYTVSAPYTIFTQIGAQRIIYAHEDTVITCVYKTDATSVEEAELELYADNYKDLGEELIMKIQGK